MKSAVNAPSRLVAAMCWVTGSVIAVMVVSVRCSMSMKLGIHSAPERVRTGSTVGATGLGYRMGLGAWWWSGSAALGCLLLAWVVAPRLHRLASQHGFLTVGDFLEYRYGPTVREIGAGFKIRSPNGVMCHLKALEKKGLITRESHMSRAIQLCEPLSPTTGCPSPVQR